jgi:hypothetical protein
MVLKFKSDLDKWQSKLSFMKPEMLESISRSKSPFLIVNRTKKMYSWKLEIDGRTHLIELFNSLMSGKKKIQRDSRVIIETKKYYST